MRIVVFGATGSVGRSLAPQALEQGLQVTALARSPPKIGPPQGPFDRRAGRHLGP
ncbi:NAD(P)H-binding protein [Caulobacter vibrioides]|uniref:NAD(P)H-binding protein n=1 Tax=Caulobacter vibrioides TaxID=155892 RepID=UPI000BB4BD04|nr:hypothetical protein CA608_09680 [Caulobacter vibrioides]PLR09541.1 hypothetical protein CVUC_15095 [Caulobacter vibrioides]